MSLPTLSREVAINEYQLGMFKKIARDISDEALFVRAPGHGHPPVWILGHLAILKSLFEGELALKMRKGVLLVDTDNVIEKCIAVAPAANELRCDDGQRHRLVGLLEPRQQPDGPADSVDALYGQDGR